MAYDQDLAKTQLTIIQGLLPDVIGVTTDIVAGPNGAHDALILQRKNGKTARVDISERQSEPDRGIRQITGNTGLDEDDARTVRTAGRELFQLNSRGAWCVEPDQARHASILAAFDDERALTASRAVRAMTHRLAELLPDVFTIFGESCSVSQMGGGRMRRRIWVRVLDTQDREMAALDTTALSTHAHDGLLQAPHEHLETNLRRLAVWSSQMGVAVPDDFQGDRRAELVHCAGEVMMLLSNTMVMLGTDEIWLRL